MWFRQRSRQRWLERQTGRGADDDLARSGACAAIGPWFDIQLVYGRRGQRIIGFDNERGKGDHMHINDIKHAYCFTTVEQLVTDFLAEVARVEALDE